MKRSCLAVALTAALACRAYSSPPKTIQDEHDRQNAHAVVARSVDDANWTCKSSLADVNVIDWDTWKTAVDSSGNYAYVPCRDAVDGAEALCRYDEIARRAFKKDVDRIVCRGDGSGDGKVELVGTTLVVHTYLGAKTTTTKVQRWLYANLRP